MLPFHIIPIIDDDHLIPVEVLRKLRLLLEDFPRNHNLILIGQPSLNTTLQLRLNHSCRNLRPQWQKKSIKSW